MQINVKPIKTLGIKFEDNKTYSCKFSAYAMLVLDEEFGGFQKVFEEVQVKPFLGGAKLLYAGMRACNEDVDFEYAKKLITHLSIEDITELNKFAANTLEFEVEKINSKKKVKKPQDFKKK